MLNCQLPLAVPTLFSMEHAAIHRPDLEQPREHALPGAGSSWGQRSYDASLAAMLFPEIASTSTFQPAQPSTQPMPTLEHPAKHEQRPSLPLSHNSSRCQPRPTSCIPPSPFAKAEDSPGELSSAPRQQSDDCDSPPEPGTNSTQQQLDEEKAERLRAKNRHAQQRYRERKVKYRDSQKRYPSTSICSS